MLLSLIRSRRPDAKRASDWSLPPDFFPKKRPPLSYHSSRDRWSRRGGRTRLQAVARGQEFVLDLDLYPDLFAWIEEVIGK